MLLITLSKLGLGSSSILPCVVVASSIYSPLPLISYEQVCSSSSFESLTSDTKVVLDFFLGGEVASLGFNLSRGVSVFSPRDWCVGKGDVVFFFFITP
jgi:hypothetical protein